MNDPNVTPLDLSDPVVFASACTACCVDAEDALASVSALLETRPQSGDVKGDLATAELLGDCRHVRDLLRFYRRRLVSGLAAEQAGERPASSVDAGAETSAAPEGGDSA